MENLNHKKISLEEIDYLTDPKKLWEQHTGCHNVLLVMKLGSTKEISVTQAAQLVAKHTRMFLEHFPIVENAIGLGKRFPASVVFGLHYDKDSDPNVMLYRNAGIGYFSYMARTEGSRMHYTEGYHFGELLRSNAIIDMHAEGKQQNNNESLFGCYKEMAQKMKDLNHENLSCIIMRSKHSHNLNFYFPETKKMATTLG